AARAELVSKPQGGRGLGEAAQLTQGAAQVAVGLGEGGRQADGLAVDFGRLAQLPLGFQSVAEVVVKGGVLGLETDGLAVGLGRLARPSLMRQGTAEVVVG